MRLGISLSFCGRSFGGLGSRCHRVATLRGSHGALLGVVYVHCGDGDVVAVGAGAFGAGDQHPQVGVFGVVGVVVLEPVPEGGGQVGPVQVGQSHFLALGVGVGAVVDGDGVVGGLGSGVGGGVGVGVGVGAGVDAHP